MTLQPGRGAGRRSGGNVDPARSGPRQGGCSELELDGR